MGCVFGPLEAHDLSTSRWATVGCVCRSLSVGLLVGILSFAATIKAMPGTGDYFIHGLARLGQGEQCVVASSQVSNVCLSQLMEDRRIPRQRGRLRHTA